MNYEVGYLEWLATRPAIIRELGKAYPPGWYIMKEGSPYGVSVPGTRVYLNGYNENGEVSVVVLAKHRLPEADEHLERKLAEFGNPDRSIFEKDIEVLVETKWLEPVKEES